MIVHRTSMYKLRDYECDVNVRIIREKRIDVLSVGWGMRGVVHMHSMHRSVQCTRGVASPGAPPLAVATDFTNTYVLSTLRYPMDM